MEQQELTELYNQLADLVNAGKEKEAQKLLKEQFPKLPSKVQGEILLRMSVAEMNNEANRLETAAKLQEEGLALIEAIETLKKV